MRPDPCKIICEERQRDFSQYTILLHTHLWSLVINILKWFWGFWLLFFLLNFWAMSCHGFHQLFSVFTGILQNDDASNAQWFERQVSSMLRTLSWAGITQAGLSNNWKFGSGSFFFSFSSFFSASSYREEKNIVP